ncbi:hypothetical protein Avbf_17033 [Armadillidium vulgare]|nr:hypothetical protein Avbf_17033 [Armadillidium vulgare]
MDACFAAKFEAELVKCRNVVKKMADDRHVQSTELQKMNISRNQKKKKHIKFVTVRLSVTQNASLENVLICCNSKKIQLICSMKW